MAFLDGVCLNRQCGHRFGWTGRIVDRPACPKCGHRPPAHKLKHDQDEVDRAVAGLRAKLLLERHPKHTGPHNPEGPVERNTADEPDLDD